MPSSWEAFLFPCRSIYTRKKQTQSAFQIPDALKLGSLSLPLSLNHLIPPKRRTIEAKASI
jgi:hypothetical protein